MLIKNRDVADEWYVYYGDNTDYLVLDDVDATADSATAWNDTSPSSTVFTVGTSHSVNADAENYIAYCWRSIEGFSKVGSYIGNGATGSTGQGPFVHTGFKPAWIMIKRSSSTTAYTNWIIYDNKRDGFNQGAENAGGNKYVFADSNVVEANLYILNSFSNGFTFYDNYEVFNSEQTYVYLCFAETPFKYSNAR